MLINSFLYVVNIDKILEYFCNNNLDLLYQSLMPENKQKMVNITSISKISFIKKFRQYKSVNEEIKKKYNKIKKQNEENKIKLNKQNYMINFHNSKEEKFKETNKEFYFPSEVWDNIIGYCGIKKISNYEKMFEIELNSLIRSFLNISNIIFKHFSILSKNYLSYIHILENIKKYIANNYNALIELNLLKYTLIYFHTKTYITFYGDYSFKPLKINLEIINNPNFFCEEIFKNIL